MQKGMGEGIPSSRKRDKDMKRYVMEFRIHETEDGSDDPAVFTTSTSWGSEDGEHMPLERLLNCLYQSSRVIVRAYLQSLGLHPEQIARAMIGKKPE